VNSATACINPQIGLEACKSFSPPKQRVSLAMLESSPTSRRSSPQGCLSWAWFLPEHSCAVADRWLRHSISRPLQIAQTKCSQIFRSHTCEQYSCCRTESLGRPSIENGPAVPLVDAVSPHGQESGLHLLDQCNPTCLLGNTGTAMVSKTGYRVTHCRCRLLHNPTLCTLPPAGPAGQDHKYDVNSSNIFYSLRVPNFCIPVYCT
jgi:hypothetical protein